MKQKKTTLQDLRDFHQQVDERVALLEQSQRERLQCRAGCNECCKDELTVFQIEADLIRASHPKELYNQEPGLKGRCAMLDKQGLCRIYESRPYVCRTQGLPLRWFEPLSLEDILEYRDICPLNEKGEALEDMDESQFWTIGEMEGILAELQMGYAKNQSRIPLRSLFSEES